MARTGVPLVTSVHNYGNWKYYRGADLYIPVTAYGASFIEEHGVPESRIRVIPNFTRIEPRPEHRTARGRKVRILAYGRFVIEKGFQDLVEACRILRARGLEVRVTIGGDGELADELRSAVDAAGLSDAVNFCGWIDDVVPYLDAADLFILPSRHEPFGIVLLEAMARSVPVVSTLAEGPAEFLSDDQVYFCDIADPEGMARVIADAIGNPDRTADKVRNAHRVYRDNYTPEAVLGQLNAAYADLLESRKAT